MNHSRGLAAAFGLAFIAGGGSAYASTNFPPNSTVSVPADDRVVTFMVYLPLRDRAGLQSVLSQQQDRTSPLYRTWLTPDQFNTRFGPPPDAVSAATAELQAEGFNVQAALGRTLLVSGTAGQANLMFSTRLMLVQAPGQAAKVVAASALIPSAALAAQGVQIPTFSGFARLHTHSKTVLAVDPASRRGPNGGYWFTDLKQAYDYPSYQALDGTGANVAVLISSDAYDADIASVFNHEHFTQLTGKPAPTLIHQPVDQPQPTVTDGLGEASLDVQQVLGGAPGATVTVVDTPDLSDASIIDGYDYIVSAKNAAGGARYQLANSSFGACEAFYTPAYNDGSDYTFILDLEQSLFEQGNAEGITFVASSGDSGGLGCPDVNYFASTPTAPSRFLKGVEFPAASPNVTAVGGTNLITAYNPSTLDSSYVGENAQGDPELPYDPYGVGANVYGGYWGAGGGVSQIFSKPSFQGAVSMGSATFRTVPDVGMQVGGCPGGIALTPCPPNRSFVIVAIQGGFAGLIGTSVASPEFVGALALAVQRNGPLGNLNPYLYTQGALQSANGNAVYNRAIPGFDGRYSTSQPSANYNYLIGNGTPRIRALFGMLDLPAAGTPPVGEQSVSADQS